MLGGNRYFDPDRRPIDSAHPRVPINVRTDHEAPVI